MRVVVPYAPGGASDVLARLPGSKLQETWKLPVVVENRTGAGGKIGTDNVAKSAPARPMATPCCWATCPTS